VGDIWNRVTIVGVHLRVAYGFVRYPELEPRHDLFLSHSGIDKDFTGLLAKLLDGAGYFLFFDKDRRSLPPGEDVRHTLFAAARQCRVLIVILSESFFTYSEWPMLELSAFVEAKKEKSDVSILPVYLGLTREKFAKGEDKLSKDKINRDDWYSIWAKWKEDETKGQDKSMESGKPAIDIGKWKEALELLDAISGKYTSCEYTQISGFQGLLDETLREVCGRIAPRIAFSDSAVQGKERLCNVRTAFLLRTASYYCMCECFGTIY
jgi:hypothetical protein